MPIAAYYNTGGGGEVERKIAIKSITKSQ